MMAAVAVLQKMNNRHNRYNLIMAAVVQNMTHHHSLTM
jgi:hypothetical protein